jgi:hypothetical protein
MLVFPCTGQELGFSDSETGKREKDKKESYAIGKRLYSMKVQGSKKGK